MAACSPSMLGLIVYAFCWKQPLPLPPPNLIAACQDMKAPGAEAVAEGGRRFTVLLGGGGEPYCHPELGTNPSATAGLVSSILSYPYCNICLAAGRNNRSYNFTC